MIIWEKFGKSLGILSEMAGFFFHSNTAFVFDVFYWFFFYALGSSCSLAVDKLSINLISYQ